MREKQVFTFDVLRGPHSQMARSWMLPTSIINVAWLVVAIVELRLVGAGSFLRFRVSCFLPDTQTNVPSSLRVAQYI
jgi:hypothetical protein